MVQILAWHLLSNNNRTINHNQYNNAKWRIKVHISIAKKWNSHRAACLLKGAPIRGGVGHAGVGWVMQGWGGSCRDGVDHTGVGWVIQGWGWSQRGGVGHAGVKWVMQGWSGSCRGGGQVGHTEAGWGGS